ncbi:serine threonine kinase [Pyrenophora seminiperda CCB06]|uniref:Serine threonine kinase n=1 Tax=Pyrenophora seminiperda CCB06 TaxID=1302712 RepID=A0A3M7MDD3_9PLEO|nr:serine threonine kinase [Pyrenophora seminiperda CCB06]
MDQKYYHFLRNVHGAYRELCIVAFTRFQVDSTKNAVLESLATRTGERRDDVHPGIRSFFMELREPEAALALQAPNHESTAISDSWYEFTHAEPEGTTSIFGEAMAQKIKNAHMNQGWKAVTVYFPKNSTTLRFSYFLKLEISEEHLSELAIALFKIEVSWVAVAFQVVHENGMVQNMPEFTHTGALEEDIIAVFHPEISSAIIENMARRRELEEGKSRTECVSMTFARSEGTITLAMDLQKGAQIQKRLYNKNA